MSNGWPLSRLRSRYADYRLIPTAFAALRTEWVEARTRRNSAILGLFQRGSGGAMGVGLGLDMRERITDMVRVGKLRAILT